MQPNDPSVPGEPNPAPPPPPPEPGSTPLAEPGASATPPPQPPGAASEPPPVPPEGAAARPPDPSTPTFNFGALPPPKIDPPPTNDDRMWGLILHLGGALGGFTATIGLPGGNLLIPLVIWLIKKDGSRFINDQGKEVLNFQICALVAAIVSLPTCVGPLVVAVAALVLGIVGGVKANEGTAYRYPLNLRLIK